ncbi:MAG: GntR family transcriptional regulator [Chloroflexota bacterium]
MAPVELPTSHKQLRHVVAEQLRMAILEGQHKPGEWLRQERLAQELGVSQMPVREALKELTAEGLVEHVPYRGVRVVAFSAEDLQDLYHHRSYLEGEAAFSAAQHISGEELARLRSLHEQMRQRMAPEYLQEYREINRRFHLTIYAASRRSYLVRTLGQMWEAFPTMMWGNYFRTALHTRPERDASDVIEHERLLAALEAHDAPLARQLAREHIQAALEGLLEALSNNSELSELHQAE